MHAIGLRPSFSLIFHLGEEIKGSSSKNTHSDSSRVFGNRVKMLIIDVFVSQELSSIEAWNMEFVTQLILALELGHISVI